MKRRSLGFNALLNGLRSVLNLIFPLITFPYVSRVLNVDGIGKYNFSNSIVSYFALIAALGISSYAVREGAKYRDNRKEISDFASQVFSINIWSTILAYLLLFMCLLAFSTLRDYRTCILIFSLQIVFTTIGTEWIYTIFEDFTYITVRSIIFQIFSIILLFIFVRNPNDYLNYASITVFSLAGSNILNFIHARQFVDIKFTWNVKWALHLPPILILFFAGIANMIYVNSDITLLGLMKNNYIVGIYSISSKIYNMGKVAVSSVLLVSVPRLAMYLGKRELISYKSLLKKVINTIMLTILPCMTGLFALAPEVLLIISGEKYLRSTSSLRILCLAYFFSSIAWIITDCILVPGKLEKYVLYSATGSALINVILNLVLIPIWSENAAAFSTIVAEFTMMCINFHFSPDSIKRVFYSKIVIRNIFDSIVGCFGIIIVCYITKNIFNNYWYICIFSVALSVIIYLIILLILKNSLAESILDKYVKKLRHYL